MSTLFNRLCTIDIEEAADQDGQPVLQVSHDDGQFSLDPGEIGPVVLELLRVGREIAEGREVRRPLDYAAEPQQDGVGGGL
ncbi:hypothetical protein [Pseudoclavibacter sp. CFCC 13611]|uniref:hypothetical protein n=1 Tax=Pseudoclavibacter sp. CFCC 13611 TaxID=2615178 RepID=UPI0013011BCA|nr:hypothetical protein [Pseudoclavibacter sp. CFCC 13611]KAB1662758.1 hypothetical protein F8O08_09305 [Pseudoclavibacter sp. CFCC 13611]